MVTREIVRQVVEESGLWDGTTVNKYSYILSPDLYEVGEMQLRQLEDLGPALQECLSGLSRIATIAHNPKLASNRTWRMVVRVLNTGVPSIYREIQVLDPTRTPAICKVDLMQGTDGRYLIAEIDGHNKHGMGYLALQARITRVIRPEAQTFPGIASAIEAEMKRRNSDGRLVLLYGHKERYYLPEFKILADELTKWGIELLVVDEVDIRIQGTKLIAGERPLDCRHFVDLPFLDESSGLDEALARSYTAGEIDFLLPPKPFFSSKAIMALLRNDEESDELEAILRSQITLQSLELIRGFIPETYLVTKGKKGVYWDSLIKTGSFVLKETISSGMKGTFFQEDGRFAKAFEQAQSSYYRFVLQREVQNAAMNFRYFSEDGRIHEGQWFGRVCVYFAGRGVAEVELTARMDKRVHGAPDCLMLGSVIV